MINIIDLFSGAGGLTEGFRNQRYKILGHVEKEKAACETLKLREVYYYLKEKNIQEVFGVEEADLIISLGGDGTMLIAAKEAITGNIPVLAVNMGSLGYLAEVKPQNAVKMLEDYENGNYKYWGRFNMGVVTLNIPYVALSSKGDKEVFWKKFDEALELVHKVLLVRYNRLKGTTSDYAPILWQHGALSRLKPLYSR